MCIGQKKKFLVLVLFPKAKHGSKVGRLCCLKVMKTMDFRLFSLATWTLLVNILSASFGFNWHYCPQNILVLVFNYLLYGLKLKLM